ncbi:MAG: hypothetical protein JW940_25500 [Polyangiaceae bacterium]|nr:hypothetical protein [Polyangiaceae bacterium]
MAPLQAWLVVACGPSIQSIYEGDVRFEHCYRLDLDPNITPSLRQMCWREWVGSYTYGQTQDRANYARRRLEQLKSQPQETAMMLDPPPDPALPLPPAFAPPPAEHVSAHRPPPPTAQAGSASVERLAESRVPDDPPGEACADSCRQTWAACSPAKQLPGEIVSESSRAECNRAYARCMRRCFDD